MTTKSEFSVVGLAHKLLLAGERIGYTAKLWNELAEHPDLLGQFLEIQLGRALIQPVPHLINCDAQPFIPSGFKVEEHKQGGQLAWSPSCANLFLAEGQRRGKWMKGYVLRKELEGQPVMNANVLDYLLAQPHLIPEEWKGKYVFFWGTIYRNADGNLYVRCLFWGGDRWSWGARWLDDDWYDGDPAALRAS